jgi:hypothetical protein
MRVSPGLFLILSVVLLAALPGCGGGDGESATVTETVSDGGSGSEGSTGVGSTNDGGSGGGGGGGDITVPDVVGEDHQLAQDTLQAAGLYSLDEEDATGQGRLLLWDRNWTVVRQDPPAGTKVNEDETITLSSKKDGE